jgi:hypothetical protein
MPDAKKQARKLFEDGCGNVNNAEVLAELAKLLKNNGDEVEFVREEPDYIRLQMRKINYSLDEILFTTSKNYMPYDVFPYEKDKDIK